MKRSQLVTAIALSLGVTGWFSPWLPSTARAADCDRPWSSSRSNGDADRGLLDTLDDLACKVLDNRPQRPSLLSTLKSSLTKNSRAKCDEPTCGAEVTCGVEPGCGVAGYGVAGYGPHYVPHDITMNHHVSPIDASRQGPPRSQQAPQWHPVPPQGYPIHPHVHPLPSNVPQVPVLPRQEARQAPAARPAAPSQPATQPALPTRPTAPIQSAVPAKPPAAVQPAPLAKPPAATPPAVPDFEAIPVPEVQDSITDPFRDDSAIQFHPRRLPAHPATHRIPAPGRSPEARKPILNYDPQARSAPARGRIRSDAASSSEAVAQAPSAASRLNVEDRRSSNARTAASDEPISSQPSSRSAASGVVPASASEPARLPPLQSVPPAPLNRVDEDYQTLPNPLRS